MRWTEGEIKAFSREEQISALRLAKEFTEKLDQGKRDVDESIRKIDELEKKVAGMKAGLTISAKLGISILLIIAGKICGVPLSFKNMLAAIVVLWVGYYILDRMKLRPNRIEKADAFYHDNYPQLYAEQKTAEYNYSSLCDSDEGYNAQQLLPDDYLVSEKIDGLINLLSSRRSWTISEAMTVFENNEHHKRVEDIEKERLEVAKEAARSQERAAIAAENTERQTREMAKKQRSMIEEQRRTASRQQQTVVVRTSSQSTGRSKNTTTCYYCKMQIPKKAQVCPYCKRNPIPGVGKYFVDKITGM